MRAAVLHAHGAVPELGDFRRSGAGDGAEVARGRWPAAMNPIDVRIAAGDVRARAPRAALRRRQGGRRAARRTAACVYFDVQPSSRSARSPSGRCSTPGSGYPVPDGLDPALASPRRLRARGVAVAGVARAAAAGRDRARPRRERRGRADRRPGREAARRRAAWSRPRATRGAASARARLGADAAVAARRRGRPRGGAARGRRRRRLRPRVRSAVGRAARVAALAAARPFGRIVHMGQSAGAEATLRSTAVRSSRSTSRLHELHAPSEERKAAAYERLARHAAAGEHRGRGRAHRPRRRAGRLAAPGQLARSQARGGLELSRAGRPGLRQLRRTRSAQAAAGGRRSAKRGCACSRYQRERAPARPLAAHHRQQRGQRARRQRRDQPLQRAARS